jgi:1,4-alpha-glucan branching enzyme
MQSIRLQTSWYNLLKGDDSMSSATSSFETTWKIFEIDPYILPYAGDIQLRMKRYQEVRKTLLGKTRNFKTFANGHHYYGFHKKREGWYYREWAPAATALFLLGDFNDWNPESHPLTRLENGCWEIFLPGSKALQHEQLVKVRVVTGERSQDRIPLYIRRAVQNQTTWDFAGQIWEPARKFKWSDEHFQIDQERPLIIYEAHVGMAQEKYGIGTYREFTENILPRVQAAGYNTIQLMAVMEHPYYASFGYQVSNFFAVSSRFGTPDELKELIDTAHSMGIAVLLDIVHSHAVKNLNEGINEFDGTDYQFFHAGARGNHPAWDSKLFQYGKHEVIHFLLSNVKYWLEEYHFDGFRFDGVTSMLYHHSGLGVAFDSYDKYFSMDTDLDAVTYLQLANELIKEVRPDAIVVAEDMSGMPGMCLPIEYGGIGFDYRLSMGVPDMWIKTLKERADEGWDLWSIWHELTTRRPYERNVGYAESHDQAMVGDKTIMFWLADKAMYWHMAKDQHNLEIERAIALHKLIRFLSLTLAGEGYLNFMGNEFGHPEWIDFPREGNNHSFHYARRQWDLGDADYLRYIYLRDFDRGMIELVKQNKVLGAHDLQSLWIGQNEKVLAYRKGGLIFVFNLHPYESYTHFSLPVVEQGDYRVVFHSDESEYGGHARVDKQYVYQTKSLNEHDGTIGFQIYIPSRTVIVLQLLKE